MESLFLELTTDEMKTISGGDLYEIGYAIGDFAAGVVDTWHGVWDGFRDEILD